MFQLTGVSFQKYGLIRNFKKVKCGGKTTILYVDIKEQRKVITDLKLPLGHLVKRLDNIIMTIIFYIKVVFFKVLFEETKYLHIFRETILKFVKYLVFFLLCSPKV